MNSTRAWLLVTMAGLFIGLMVYAATSNYLLFADGGFFAFALSANAPWDLVWRQFPSRLGAMFLTQGLPWWLADHGASSALVARVYQVNFLSVPLFAVAATWFLTRRTAWVAWAAFGAVLLSFPLMGFPSEVYVAGSLLTPLAAWILDGGMAKVRGMGACILAVFFVFSHEAAALCLPMLMYMVYRECGRDPRRRSWLVTMGGVLCVAAMALLAVKQWWPPSNPHVAQAMVRNAQTIFQFSSLKRPLADFSMLGTAYVLVAPRVRRAGGQKALDLALVGLMVSSFVLAMHFDEPGDRYDCRTVMVWLMPVMALFYAGRPLLTPVVVPMTFALFLCLAIIHVKSIRGWNHYQSVLASNAFSRQGMNGGEWKKELQIKHPELAGYYWTWAAPYASIMSADQPEDVRLLMDRSGWYAPMTCPQAMSIASEHAFKGFDQILKEDTCRKQQHPAKAGGGNSGR